MTVLAQVTTTQANKETTINQLFNAVNQAGLFGWNEAGSNALTLAYYGGTDLIDGVLTTIANANIALGASVTNFVEAAHNGSVFTNNAAFTAGRRPMLQVTTNANGITGVTDMRVTNFPKFGFLSLSVAGNASVTLNAAQARVTHLRLTGALTGNINVNVPAVPWQYTIDNATSGAFSITVKTPSGSGVVVPQGTQGIVWSDGTNVLGGVTGASGNWSVGGNLTVLGQGPHGIGIAPFTNAQLALGGTHSTATGVSRAFDISSTVNAVANNDAQGMRLTPTIVEASSGNHGQLDGMVIAPTYTNGGANTSAATTLRLASFAAPSATVTAATLRVEGEPTGATNNYAILVNGGKSRFQGDIVFGASLVIRSESSDASDTGVLQLTGGGAVATSRGATLDLWGNENANTGILRLSAGDVSGGVIIGNTANGEKWRTTREGYFKASNAGTYWSGATNTDHEFDSSSNTYVLTNANTHNSAPFGVRIRYTAAAPNGTSNFFMLLDDTSATRFELRSNGGLANFQANDVNLSDRRAKSKHVVYDEALLDRMALALDRVDWGRYKYNDQTHEDWNHGPSAQGVREAFNEIAPEIVDVWDPKAKVQLLSIYTHDLNNIAIAALLHRVRKLEARSAH